MSSAPRPPTEVNAHVTDCAVILRTLNEAEGLRALLPILAAQKPEPPRIIAVDSGSTDETLPLLEAAGARTIKLAPEQFSYGRALNVGLAEVQEPFAALISAHAVPRSCYWVAELIGPMKADPSIAAVSGACNGQIPHLPKQHTNVVLASAAQCLANPMIGLVNANAAIRMSVWREHAFDEEMIACEDKEWTLRVLEAGHKVLLSTGGDVWHFHGDDSPRELYRRGYREHFAMYGYFPTHGVPWLCAEVFGRPLVWLARGFRRSIGHAAWRLGQVRGSAAARRARRRASNRGTKHD